MLAVANKSGEDEMVNGEIEPLKNGAQINGEQDDDISKTDIALSLANDDDLDHEEDEHHVESNNKVNGDAESEDWSSSLESEADLDPYENPSDTNSAHLLNETSSHSDGNVDRTIVNCNLNGNASVPNKNTAIHNCEKKVRPLKICFGVKNSVNGIKVKNAKTSQQDDVESRVHYVEQRAESDSEESPENEAQPEYAQYLGLQPSVKFKCSRCGMNNFNTMTLLKEHMASCSGQTSLTAVGSVSTSLCKGHGDEKNAATNLRITRKVFLCSSCGTYYQSYDLYIHMRELHNKQICLFCFNMFCRTQQLWDHLIAVHNLKLGEYANVSQIRNAFKGSFYITCCTCNRIFTEDEHFNDHICQTQGDAQTINVNPNPVICAEEDTRHVTQTVPNDSEKLPSSSSESEDSPMSPPIQLSPVPQNKIDDEPIIDQIPPDTETPPEERSSDREHDLSPPHLQQPVADEYSADEETRPSPVPEPSADVDSNEQPFTTDNALEPDNAEASDALQHENVENNDPPVPPNDDESANRVVNDCENGSVKEDTSDSETLNALFDQSTVVEPEAEKIVQPLPMALMLDDTVASLSPQALIKECIRTSCTSCTYCNNAILIAINGKQLATHLLSEHRYKPTKNEDDSEQVTQKIEACRDELQDVYMNASSNEFDGTFACFQCSFSTTLLKELCAHKRKAHQMNIFLCIVCKCNFFHYSALLCHECPGEYSCDPNSLRFRCCYCPLNHIPSAFRLMVHLRKFHKSCDFCLLRYNDQYELFSHMTKQHKMHHLCYKCNLAYRSRNDINKHLFWKHGTESVLCKKCLQKKWPHAYHFCMPAATYTCEECNRVFTKAVALTVHRRAHTGEFKFACECDQRFISKRLLSQHRQIAHSINDGVRDETLNTSNESAGNPQTNEAAIGDDQRPENGGSDGDKKRRKKKRKKEKVNEKPLLDELPPLNLSSESDDESGPDDEPPAKGKPPVSPASPVKPPPSPTSPTSPDVTTAETSTPLEPHVEETPPAPPSPPRIEQPSAEEEAKIKEAEARQNELLEKALNCLLIEHSYCIPDAIFHSEPAAAAAEGDETTHLRTTPDARDGSPHKHDATKSCCKSTTPHKRKRAKKNSSAGESSSSASSSDSDSSSSSCGSNCSCNRSNSNCSSSSSGTDYSTTPEKKKSKSKQKRKEDQIEADKRTQEQREQIFLLDARETDLDTDISSAGEDFYEERPRFVPPPPSLNDKKVESNANETVDTTASGVDRSESKSSRSSRKDKKKKRKKIKLNLAGRIPPNCNPLKNTNVLTTSTPILSVRGHVSVPNNEFVNRQAYPPHLHYMETKPSPYMRHDSIGSENYANSDAAGDESNSGRLSKRKRVKNKFYGYSSSDEASRDSSSVKSLPKKRVFTKKNNTPKNRHFVGIRAKQLPPLPKRLSISVPFTPVPSAQITDTYKPTPAPPPPPPSSQSNVYNPYNQSSSSEDSDSDEKRHTLVINLPSVKQKINNSHRPPMYSDESRSSNSLISSPRVERPIPATAGPNLASHHLASQHSGAYTNSPLKNSEKLYCYCQCPYDEVSEMIGCDAPNCEIEWFHFECVGIMVPPKGKWYCPSCFRNRENVSRFV